MKIITLALMEKGHQTPKLSRVKTHPLSWVSIVEFPDVNKDKVVELAHGRFDVSINLTFKVLCCSTVVALHAGVHVGG